MGNWNDVMLNTVVVVSVASELRRRGDGDAEDDVKAFGPNTGFLEDDSAP